MSVPPLARTPVFWLAAFLAWFAILWQLSAIPAADEDLPVIPGLDKVLHFGYYFGGAGLLAAALFLLRRRGRSPAGPAHWPALVTLVTLLMAAVGLLDEWHQSWVPGRFGNDPGDWLADVCGACAGALVFRRLHHLVLPVDRAS